MPSVCPQRRASALLLVLALTGGGCAGDGPANTDTAAGFPTIQKQIFDQSCLAGGCHNSISRAGNLVLVDGQSYQQLVNRQSDNAAAQQAGLARVTPFQPDASFLLIKVTNPAPSQGSRMPLSAAPLSSAQIDMIRQWIAGGALESGGASQTPAPSPTATHSPSATPTASATASPPPSATPTITPTGILPSTATPTVTPTSTATPTATTTPTFNDSATLANIEQEIFTPTCTDPSCHSAIGRAGDLVLEADPSDAQFVYNQLVNVPAANFAASQESLLRVEPGNADGSFLLIKLHGPTPPQGARMPSGKPPLTDSQLQLIHDWISQGALPSP